MKLIVLGLRLFFCIFLIEIKTDTFAAYKESGELVLEAEESKEDMRRRILSTVESAKRYQDMMDQELKTLKIENKDLHEKLIKLKNQFEAALGIREENKNKAMETPSTHPKVVDTQENASNQTPADLSTYAIKPSGIPHSNAILEIKSEPKPNSKILRKIFIFFSDPQLIVSLCILILLLMVWFLWGRTSKLSKLPERKKYSSRTSDSFTGLQHLSHETKEKNLKVPAQQMLVPIIATIQEGEYDYIGSMEAIPAKLDLARMYRDMEDLAAAELVLKSILLQGNETQCMEASELLEEINLFRKSPERSDQS